MASKSKTKTDAAPAVDSSNPQTDDTGADTDASNPKSKPATAVKITESKSKASESRSLTSHKLMMKAAELAERKRKEREAHPERMKYFLPRVYEHWEDDSAIDEELKEQEKMMKEIKEKEELLQKKKDAGTFDSQDEEEEEELNEKKAVYHRLKTRKKREALYLKRLEDQLEREEQERALKEAERVHSELLNPSKYGWYYGDGYYNTSENLFGLKDELVEKFQTEQDGLIEKGRTKNLETFTDKFKRHFWPPKLLFKGKIPFFRTRGVYLDFPEVAQDMPHSVGVNYERDEQAFLSNTLFKGEEIDENLQKPEDEESDAETEGESDGVTGEGDENKAGKKKGKGKKKTWKFDKKKAKINTGWDQWYYDDDAGEFFPKREGFTGEYYMDGVNLCWRHKRPPRLNFKRQPTPYDWYYDVNKGQVLARADYLGFDEFEYDHKLGVFLLKSIKYTKELKKLRAKSYRFGIFGRKQKKVNAYEQPSTPPPKRPVTDFYFDEKFGCWLPKDDPKPDPDETVVVVEPSATNVTENAAGSAEAAASEPVEPEEPSVDIVWDENGHRFTRKWEGEWRGLTGLSPDDYYFDDDKGLFLPKPPRQGRFFKYHPSDGVWRKGNVPAPNKLRPQLKNVLAPSDYYFDNFQGQFLPKNIDKGARYDYWLQKYSRTWRKHLEPKTGMYPEDFYWDVDRKLWLPKSMRMEMMKNAQSLRNKWAKEITGGAFRQSSGTPNDYFWDTEQGEFLRKDKIRNYYLDQDGYWKCEALKNTLIHRTFAHDFFFDHINKEFRRKNKGHPYVFNNTKNVWTVPGAPKDFVLDFYYDVETEKWLPGEYGKVGTLLQGFPTASHLNPNYRIPDDYWFDEDYGQFELKRIEDMHRYFFNPSEGAWKKRGNLGPSRSNLHPRNFYFDERVGRFRLKTLKTPQLYCYDHNNKIFRYVASNGATRTGYQPKDFHWNSDLKTYILINTDQTHGTSPAQPTDWDPMRRYNKGWLKDDNLTKEDPSKTAPPPPDPTKLPEAPRNSSVKGSKSAAIVERNVKKKTTFAIDKK